MPRTTNEDTQAARVAQRNVPPPTAARRPVGVGTKTPDAVHAHGWLRNRLQPRGGRATPPARRRQSGGDSAGVRYRRAATARVALPTGGMIGARGGGREGHNDSNRGRGGSDVATPHADAKCVAPVGAPAAALAVFWPLRRRRLAAPRRGSVTPPQHGHGEAPSEGHGCSGAPPIRCGAAPRLSQDVGARPATPLQHIRKAQYLRKAHERGPLASSSHPSPPTARRNRRGADCEWSNEPAEGFTVTRSLSVNGRCRRSEPNKRSGQGNRSHFSSNCDFGGDGDLSDPCAASGSPRRHKYNRALLIPLSISCRRALIGTPWFLAGHPPSTAAFQALQLVLNALWLFLLEKCESDV